MTSRERPLPPEGVYTANWIPYGYKYNPDSIDYLEIDDEVSDAVQYIFAQFIDGIAIKDILPDLEEMGYIIFVGAGYPIIRITEMSYPVLRGNASVKIKKLRKVKTKVEKVDTENISLDLLNMLKELRTEIARKKGVPAYLIFFRRNPCGYVQKNACNR